MPKSSSSSTTTPAHTVHNAYYSLLNVAPTASPSVIKKSYTTLALTFHPDKRRTASDKSTTTPHF